MPMWWYQGGGGGGMWWGGWLMMFGFWLLVVLAVVVLVRLLLRSGREERGQDREPRERRGPTPTEILEERFARGEIDEAEFKSRRETLSKT